ncbi:uncharacterized protein LOC126907699 [Daktulosphaira vitifoliae]|uniref:uncharacterized protein LOC126907699 n=1 Tax=Daktulosphaira vitifoliae TaxID=58002 RepID=UPI0021A9F9AF|nr:uncharacterized protein LOC126907699 [Daktulosphaira vitifoliae]
MFFYRHNDLINVRIFKILKFLVSEDKFGDTKSVENLNINEVEIISNKFCNLDTDNNCFINKEGYNTLIDFVGECALTGSVNIKTLDDKNIENLREYVIDLKKTLQSQYNLSDVMLYVLLLKANFNKTDSGILETLNHFENIFYSISMDYSVNEIDIQYHMN